ncbi:MAG TPA: VOC family protein [Capillimicrobium sp.]|nr:VOC family protein [Capillimicrobium sp.]
MTDAGVVRGVHHVGATVADMDAALAFWEPFLDRPARFRGVLSRPYLGQSVGHPGVAIDAAIVDLPGGGVLELLDYHLDGREQRDDDTKHPGNVHLCLDVADAAAAFDRAVSLGARPVNPGGPVEVDSGPNRGARVAYLRVHDGVSVELFQPPD